MENSNKRRSEFSKDGAMKKLRIAPEREPSPSPLDSATDDGKNAAIEALRQLIQQFPALESLPHDDYQKIASAANALRNLTLMESVHPNLLSKLKDHQKDGLKYLFARVIGPLDEDMGKGNGAILAHHMGLGKTVTIITFLHTILNYSKCKPKISSILVVVPKNVIEQWGTEIKKWINNDEAIKGEIIILTDVEDLKSWKTRKEINKILLLTYEQLQDYMEKGSFVEHLSTPDIAVFDEAHRMKNYATKIHATVAKVNTQRKIFLTGTPYQNNLMEFYNLVNLIEKDLLGSEEEFKEIFKNPIEQGQFKGAEECLVRQMQIRCNGLFKIVENVFHRRTIDNLRSHLPGINLNVMTIRVRPSAIQRDLTQKYIDYVASNGDKKQFMTDVAVLSRISAHPTLVHKFAERRNEKWMENHANMKEGDRLDCSLSNKLTLLLKIIKLCEIEGDKLLIFSQYTYMLNFIEEILKSKEATWFDNHQALNNDTGKQWGWKKDVDYFRNDGTVEAKNRKLDQDNFNAETNQQCRLMLISSKAGSLGTNLIGANRAVIFDFCWNPTIDLQSVFRIFRLGQEKSVFVYRLLTHDSVESVIYKRQITKESTSHRVLDEKDVLGQFTAEEQKTIYIKYSEPNDIGNDSIIHHSISDGFCDIILAENKEAVVRVESHDSYFDGCNNPDPNQDLGYACGHFSKWYEAKQKKKSN